MVTELTKLPNEVLDRLHAACHEAAKELQGDQQLKDAMRNEAFSLVFRLELATFEAIKFQYITKQRNSL